MSASKLPISLLIYKTNYTFSPTIKQETFNGEIWLATDRLFSVYLLILFVVHTERSDNESVRAYTSFVNWEASSGLSLPTLDFSILAVAFIASRVDYCNAVLYGVPDRVVQQLQMVMNAAACFFARFGKFAHITPVLRDVLHWLPVSKRTPFKVALLAFDCGRGMGPTYFTRVCVLVSDNTARSSLRSAQRGDLFVPRTRTKLGTRSSVSRDTFKSRLKSHFYADVYLHQVWERSRLRQTMTLTLTLTLVSKLSYFRWRHFEKWVS